MLNLTLIKRIFIVSSLITANALFANSTVNMNLTAGKGVGENRGTITISETKYGLLFTPNLHDLTPGAHGFHIHQVASCDNNGMAAGGHLDPKNTGKHLGPYNENGHLGDLPLLFVAANGTAITPLLAPRLTKLRTIKHHALMIHDAGDNYSDQPEKLGGGGSRMVCGVID